MTPNGTARSALDERVCADQDYRRAHNASLAEAKDHVYRQGALERYRQITGFRETTSTPYGIVGSVSSVRPVAGPSAHRVQGFVPNVERYGNPESFNEC
jgi:hypothetical protein